MSSYYRTLRAEKQEDPRSCWAACLAWWLRATINRPSFQQYELIEEYTDLWMGGDGTVSRKALYEIVTDYRWQMKTQWIQSHQLTPDVIREHLLGGPIYIGYREPAVGGNHVNVIYDIIGTDELPRVKVMEPNGGKHRTRSLTRYKNGGELILASPYY
jgi:hypothetical protein